MEEKELQRPLVGNQDRQDSGISISVRQENKFSLNSELAELNGLHVPNSDNDEEEENDEADAYDDYVKNVSRIDKQSVIGHEIAWRKIHVNEHDNLNEPDRRFCSNEIHTAKYTWWSFLPKNLFFQFTKLANIYFLVMMIFQMIPQISISDGMPTILLPLGFVVLVSMVKDIIEDTKRHKSDNTENSSKILCFPRPDQIRYINPEETGVFKTLKWSQIKVGQIVKVLKDQYFPADLILLNSDDPLGICFVETKNLDGETNMKSKTAHKYTVPCTQTDEDVSLFTGEIDCQGPNEFLYKFEGNMKFNPAKADYFEGLSSFKKGMNQISLDANQILLRGSSLRNTNYIYGIVIYTGHESKIMKNSPKTRNKVSKIEAKTNFLTIFLF